MEGRNKETVLEMLQHLRQVDQVMFSVEVEKCNRGFEDFIPLADVVFISKVTEIINPSCPVSAGVCMKTASKIFVKVAD